jgi:cytochrome c oxidase subunit 2
VTWIDWALQHILFLPPRASTFAPKVDHLHYFIILTTMVVGAIIFGAETFFVIRFRRRSEAETTPIVKSKIAYEFVIWGFPLSFFLACFYIGYHDYVWAETPPKDAMDVYVTAKQWMWKFTYPEGPNSVGVLRVPVHRPVRLIMTSRDVIHSLFVPEFRIKQDVVPGRYTQIWFEATKPGTYRIFCAEYCGLMHSDMYGEVVALGEQEFDAWLAENNVGYVERRDALPSDSERPPALADMREQGRRIAAEKGCLHCHTTDGKRLIGPTWLDMWMRKEQLSDGTTVVADDGYLTESMMDPGAKVVAGFEPVMPVYQGQLSPLEVGALLEFIKSLRSGPATFERREAPAYAPVH